MIVPSILNISSSIFDYNQRLIVCRVLTSSSPLPHPSRSPLIAPDSLLSGELNITATLMRWEEREREREREGERKRKLCYLSAHSFTLFLVLLFIFLSFNPSFPSRFRPQFLPSSFPSYMFLANLAGVVGVTVLVGYDSQGLPVAVQVGG